MSLCNNSAVRASLLYDDRETNAGKPRHRERERERDREREGEGDKSVLNFGRVSFRCTTKCGV